MVFHVVATRDQTRGEICKSRHRFEVERSLDSNFTRWRKDHTSSADYLGVFLQVLDNRDYEGSCFSGASSCHSDNVKALKNDGNSATLNRSWQVVSLRLNCLKKFWHEIV